MTAIATTPTHHLISDTTLYAFVPGTDGVAVTITAARHRSTYRLPRDEARQLYRTLLLRGFRPW